MSKLADAVLELFTMLDQQEQSEVSDKLFNPTRVSSCRTAHIERLKVLMPRIKQLAEDTHAQAKA